MTDFLTTVGGLIYLFFLLCVALVLAILAADRIRVLWDRRINREVVEKGRKATVLPFIRRVK